MLRIAFLTLLIGFGGMVVATSAHADDYDPRHPFGDPSSSLRPGLDDNINCSSFSGCKGDDRLKRDEPDAPIEIENKFSGEASHRSVSDMVVNQLKSTSDSH